MVKQYLLSVEDLRILIDRVPDPCSGCKDGPTPGDYGYMGCGREHTCNLKGRYDEFMRRAKDAGLEDLARLCRQVDVLLAQKKDIERQLNEVGAKIGGEYGTKILMDISHNLYKGEF